MIRLGEIIAAWNRFFFEPQSPLPIAIYRFLVGLLVLVNHALIFSSVPDWFGAKGTLAFETAKHLSGGTGFNLFDYLPRSDGSAWFVFGLSSLAALFVLAGLFTRVSAAVLFLTLVTLSHRNPLIVNSGDSFLRIATFFLIFSHAGAAFSLDRLIRIARGKESGEPERRAPWAMRLIQLQLAFLYLYTFIWKAMGPMWLSGTAVYYTSRLMEFWRFPVPYVNEHMWTIKLWTWATLVLEFALAVLVWIKEFRYWILLMGVLLHLGIDYSMNIPLFGYIMISAYITFVEPADLDRFFSWARTRWNSLTQFKGPVPVFYDGNCSFCTRSVEILKRLDVLHRFNWVDMHHPETARLHPGFDRDRGEKEILVRLGDNWTGGFHALREIARHLPLLWPVVPLMHLPQSGRAGSRIYRRIAERRYCILDR